MSDEKPAQFLSGDYQALESRGITKETCEFWNYQVGYYDGAPCHIANYRDATGKLTHQQLRLPGKQFKMIGGGNAPLYGLWLWPGKGKSITIVTGLLDALSVSQVFGNRWPVVSAPNGDGSLVRACEQSYQQLDGYEKIVLMCDQDEPGLKAAEEVAMVLPAGKVHIAKLPRKDPNETLLELGPEAVSKAFWNASPWRPDGIISGRELTRERLKAAVATGYEIGLPQLDDMTFGLRKGEVTTLTAGTGIGKSTWAREIAYKLQMTHGLKIGNVFLEEPNVKTGQAYASIHHNVALKELRRNTSLLSDAQWDEVIENVTGPMLFYDHFGSLDSKNLLAKLRYLAQVEKCDFIILDHISIVVSGTVSDEGERKDIDMLMTSLATLVEQTSVGIIAIVHLRRDGKSDFNAGDQIALRHLRGSASLEQLSWNVFALERDQQGENNTESRVRVLKCRETGETGEADLLIYNRDTGRLELAAVAAL